MRYVLPGRWGMIEIRQLAGLAGMPEGEVFITERNTHD